MDVSLSVHDTNESSSHPRLERLANTSGFRFRAAAPMSAQFDSPERKLWQAK
jgi:hypothetical protein